MEAQRARNVLVEGSTAGGEDGDGEAVCCEWRFQRGVMVSSTKRVGSVKVQVSSREVIVAI